MRKMTVISCLCAHHPPNLKASKQKNVGNCVRTRSLQQIMSFRCCSFSGPDPGTITNHPITHKIVGHSIYYITDIPNNSSTLSSIFLAQCFLIGSDMRIICATDSPSLKIHSFFVWLEKRIIDVVQQVQRIIKRSVQLWVTKKVKLTYLASKAAARKSFPAFRLPLNKMISFGFFGFIF